MGMTIDDVIKHLERMEAHERRDVDNDKQALAITIICMRKYKKIEQILRESKNLESYIKSDLPYELIRGVVEYGKDI